mmetsp:Transcript_9195/g.22544  ORF Transcript_9195/g.22544 Transcript_9195/m.22544 type:complete len:88 (+) Transcript_9195:1618-1881(+)
MGRRARRKMPKAMTTRMRRRDRRLTTKNPTATCERAGQAAIGGAVPCTVTFSYEASSRVVVCWNKFKIDSELEGSSKPRRRAGRRMY